jgi:hypothetical protein
MTPTDRAAAVVSRLIAANLIAAPFEDVPDGTYYASIIAAVADAIREAEAAMREKDAAAAASLAGLAANDPDDIGPDLDTVEQAANAAYRRACREVAAAIRALPLD